MGSRLVSTLNSSTLQTEFGNRAKEEGLALASALLYSDEAGGSRMGQSEFHTDQTSGVLT